MNDDFVKGQLEAPLLSSRSASCQDPQEELRHTSAELRQLREQFFRAQKMEVVGVLASGLVHDFNNLLTVIRGRSELLLDDEKLTSEGADSVRQIVSAADRAAGLTRQLLQLSQSQPAQPSALDLNSLLTNLSKMLRRILGPDIPIEAQLASGLPLINADQTLIEQAVLNLALHAREVIPAGGGIRISTVDAPAGTAKADALHAGSARYIRLTFQHALPEPGKLAGIGTAGEPKRDHHPAAKVNLTLAAVYSIAAQHEGWIDIQEETRQRSYHLFLPAPCGLKPPDSGHLALLEAHGRSERVLILEEDQALRRFLTLLMQRLGYQVREAADGSQTTALFQEETAGIHLLILDTTTFGERNGAELLTQLRQSSPSLRAILIGPRKESLTPGWDAKTRWLGKPFTPEMLALAVRECLDQAE
jgi:two-component system cell cycle sensor histidine kinase/response regulator CckA